MEELFEKKDQNVCVIIPSETLSLRIANSELTCVAALIPVWG